MFGLLGESQENARQQQSPTEVAVKALLSGWSLLEATAIADDQAQYL